MKKTILLVPVIMVISLIIFLVKITSVSYLNISCNRAEGVRIIINAFDENYNDINVDYTTNDRAKIKTIVEYANTIPFKYSNAKSGGQSPSAWIELLGEKGETVDIIYFYDNLLWYDGELYKIDMTVYKQIKEMCDELSNTNISN